MIRFSFKDHAHKKPQVPLPVFKPPVPLPPKKENTITGRSPFPIEEVKKEEIKGDVKVTGLPPIALAAKKREEEKKIAVSAPKKEDIKLLATYNFISDNIPITIRIYKKKGEFVPVYDVSISSISKNTEIILEKIREELTAQVSLGMVDILTTKDSGIIEQKFIDTITSLVNKHFPDA